jgi:hypothetical protein
VSGPTCPSTSSPCSSWNLGVARNVLSSNPPVTSSPGSATAFSCRCQILTSDPSSPSPNQLFFLKVFSGRSGGSEPS